MSDTRLKLLDLAQDLVQTRGFNAFSFKDLATAVEIKTASVHYHFPSKEDLGVALMDRYLDELERALSTLDRKHAQAGPRLRGFTDLYRATRAKGAICLCGSLAADLETLPESLRGRIAAYMERSERWLRDTIAGGIEAGELEAEAEASPRDLAVTFLASLQGALVVARARQDKASFDAVRRQLLHLVGHRG